MLVELSMVEQRYDAVREVLDGVAVTDVSTRYGVDRRTPHRWLVRHASEGLAALADRSSKPDRCPHQMAPEIEARIVELRRAHPGWGPRSILFQQGLRGPICKRHRACAKQVRCFARVHIQAKR